jgi:hypothetical protein
VVEEARDREMDAIGWRARHIVDAGLGFEHAQRDVEGERVAGATTIAVGRHDGHRRVVERDEGFSQTANTFCTEAVVVTDQYLHRGALGVMEAMGAVEALK